MIAALRAVETAASLYDAASNKEKLNSLFCDELKGSFITAVQQQFNHIFEVERNVELFCEALSITHVSLYGAW